MAIKIPSAILKKALTLALGSTKKLVQYGADGNSEFPELLSKYKWSGTRDYNMAMIIIALYVYCLRQEDKILYNFGKKATLTGENSVFEALERGEGPIIAQRLKEQLNDDVQKALLPDADDKTLEKVFTNGLFKQAKTITPWKINKSDVKDYVGIITTITDMVQKQNEAVEELEGNAKKYLDDLKLSNEHIVLIEKELHKITKELANTKATDKSEIEKLKAALSDKHETLAKLEKEYNNKRIILDSFATNNNAQKQVIKELKATFEGKGKSIENELKEIESDLDKKFKHSQYLDKIKPLIETIAGAYEVTWKFNDFKKLITDTLKRSEDSISKVFKYARTSFPTGKFEDLTDPLYRYFEDLRDYIITTLGIERDINDRPIADLLPPVFVLVSKSGKSIGSLTNPWRQIYTTSKTPASIKNVLSNHIKGKGYCGTYADAKNDKGCWYYTNGDDAADRDIKQWFIDHEIIAIFED